MLSLDILICTVNTRIVRIPEILMPPQEGVHYVVSFQYTKEDFLKLIPSVLRERNDVTFTTLCGEGLSANRNHALKEAHSDLVYWVDDDVRFLPGTVETINDFFETHPNTDLAFFKAETYKGRPLRTYKEGNRELLSFVDCLNVLTIEMVCRRESIQGRMVFNTEFGLGAKLLNCYEQQVWMEDAKREGLQMECSPQTIIQSSALFLPRMIYVDAKVQRAFGGLMAYVYGSSAPFMAFKFSLNLFRKRLAHFWPMFNHLMEGINYLRKLKVR